MLQCVQVFSSQPAIIVQVCSDYHDPPANSKGDGSCDVDCRFFDVKVKFLPDAQSVCVKQRSRPFFDVVKNVDAVTNV